ncbi:MAG: hypothetical protein A2X12_09640 [Bacteroidetes bacterium GWE2_29_8]|nr:MAG: hypothetical protein A2X12_09640 [Bacteroidetes bacterium GWE2_29_8]OFY20081.1 MAG: hypothetical protein A2X02_06875 [Bacteroidetes bacterium GWF2_29_10]
MEQFKKKYVEEAVDLIADLEKSLLELERDFENKNVIEKIFRVMHSLKGGSAMFGFDLIDNFTHHLESIYDNVRTDKIKIDDELLNITLDAVDHLKSLLNEENTINPNFIHTHEQKLEIVKQISNKVLTKNTVQNVQQKIINSNYRTYHIYFKPDVNIFKNGTNPLFIIDDISLLGFSKAFPNYSGLPEFSEIDVEGCYIAWDVFLSTSEPFDLIKDIFIFVDSECEIKIEELASFNLMNDDNFCSFLTQMYNDGYKIDIGLIKSNIKIIENDFINKEISVLDNNRNENVFINREATISSIRVASEKLDDLIDWVSELVTIQARLSLYAEHNADSEIGSIAEEVEKISRRLRDNVFSIRLIPIENMVTRFQRLVRELSHELKKEIVFETEGTETELDKNIIESLNDPIMHIIRNCIDHGIEDSETRISKGKKVVGKIKLKAFYSGTSVYIQISDDGKGIDISKVKKMALEKQLITDDSILSEKEILDFVFLPGFSTAQEVTKVSGRGVGMDVVKRKITDLRGEVDITSEINKGTVVTVKLPLTLSIIDGLLVKIEHSHFVIPLASVDKCFEFKHEVFAKNKTNIIYAGSEHISYTYLRDMFDMQDITPEIESLVVIEFNDTKVGMVVDSIVGQYQAVLKPLGAMYKKQDIVSGATILGDGTVALVVDPIKIINKVIDN